MDKRENSNIKGTELLQNVDSKVVDASTRSNTMSFLQDDGFIADVQNIFSRIQSRVLRILDPNEYLGPWTTISDVENVSSYKLETYIGADYSGSVVRSECTFDCSLELVFSYLIDIHKWPHIIFTVQECTNLKAFNAYTTACYFKTKPTYMYSSRITTLLRSWKPLDDGSVIIMGFVDNRVFDLCSEETKAGAILNNKPGAGIAHLLKETSSGKVRVQRVCFGNENDSLGPAIVDTDWKALANLKKLLLDEKDTKLPISSYQDRISRLLACVEKAGWVSGQSDDTKNNRDSSLPAIPRSPSTPFLMTATTTQDTKNAMNISSSKSTQAAEESFGNIPLDMDIENSIRSMLSASEAPTKNWVQLSDKNGVLVEKSNAAFSVGKGPSVFIRAQGNIEAPLPDIFSLCLDVQRLQRVNSTVFQSIKNLSCVCSTCELQYIKLNPILPIMARDFFCANVWRVLDQKKIVLISFSPSASALESIALDAEATALRSAGQDAVRGTLLFAGFILSPMTPTTTHVQYFFKAYLKGSVPQEMLSLFCSNIGATLGNVKTELECSVPKTFESVQKSFSHEDLGKLAAIHSSGSHEDLRTALSGSETPNKKRVNESEVSASTSAFAPSSSNPLSKSYLRLIADFVGHEGLYGAVIIAGLAVTSYRILVVRSWLSIVLLIAPAYAACLLLFRKFHGYPIRQFTRATGSGIFPPRKIILKFPAPLKNLLAFLDDVNDVSESEVSLTHVVLRAAAISIAETPRLNGRLIGGLFYQNKNNQGASSRVQSGNGPSSVDVSVIVDIEDAETVAVKISSAVGKEISVISGEVQEKVRALRIAYLEGSSFSIQERLLYILPETLARSLFRVFNLLVQSWGVSWPALSIDACPLGSCMVVTTPSVKLNERAKDGDADLDMTIVPLASNAPYEAHDVPVEVILGGVRLLPCRDSDGRFNVTPVLNVSVCVDSRCSVSPLTDARSFAVRILHYLSDPALMDESAELLRLEAVSRRVDKV